MFQGYFHDIFRLIYVDMGNLLNDDMNLYRNSHNIHVNLDIIHHYSDINHQQSYFDIFQTLRKKKNKIYQIKISKIKHKQA